MRNLSLHLHLKKKEISTYQICDHRISRDGKIIVGNSPSGDVHIQNTLQVFQVLIPEMIKFSSSWRHVKKVLKDQEKRISPLQLENCYGIWS